MQTKTESIRGNMKLKENEVLEDLQFNGLQIIQNKNLYRFTTDAVLLANFAKAKPTDRVVDLCSGSGVVGILLQAKTNCNHMVLVELQQNLADISKRSVQYNHLEKNIEVINAPLQNVHKQLGSENVEVVVCNPPYKMQNASLLGSNESINICKHELTVTLQEIVKEGAKLLKFCGVVYTVNKEERLTDLLVYLRANKLEPKEVLVVPSQKGSSLILVKAKKGGKSGVRVNVMS